ncbi:uncharacterized protein LOC124926646 [Impatiens glandulifera]|uniref:uncharacterized protein LOC124926646 n=1 Tax=Impatiens glandulifera TaxID=253017 RepID=UPI001FB12925|nr:uncharacterized protein LOC124926646 [Impatiens glandulifera]
MTSFSFLGIGLSFAFGCMLLGLVAELYYLLWWKKRISSRITEDHYSSSQSDVGKKPSHLFCGRSLPLSRCIESSSIGDEVTDQISSTDAIVEHEGDLELGIRGVVKMGNGEEGAECEIMRMYNMCGPPRFLFTIKEETKDELVESNDDYDDRKSRTRSMSDAPFLSPLGSPVLKTHNHHHHGYNMNPLFEHFTEVEEEVMNRVRCSPPPKFKFMRDAEEKLVRKLMEEAQIKKAAAAGK